MKKVAYKSFREFLNESGMNEKIELNTNIEGIAIDMFLTETLHFANQLHVWHWLARSGQKHTVLGEFYTTLREEVDGLAEMLIAQNILPVSRGSKILDTNYSDEVIMYQTKEYRQFITNLIEKIKEIPDLSNIFDKLADFQEEIDKFIYKFDLE